MWKALGSNLSVPIFPIAIARTDQAYHAGRTSSVVPETPPRASPSSAFFYNGSMQDLTSFRWHGFVS